MCSHCVDKWNSMVYNKYSKQERKSNMQAKKSDNLHIRIDPAMKEKLNQICQQEHRTQSAQVEYWISQFKLKEEI